MGNERKAALALAGLVAATTLLAGCGEPKAVPMDDEYAGNSGETAQSQAGSSDDADGSDASGSDGASDDASDNDSGNASGDDCCAGEDTGVYADGTYSINGQYGPIGEDTIDVHLTIADGAITDVQIVGHPFTTISKNHQDAFAEAIGDVVVGRPLAGLSVDTVAGASWTTEAFNAALDVAREEASIPRE